VAPTITIFATFNNVGNLLIIYTTVTNSEHDDTACRLSSFLSHKIPVPEIINSYALK